MSICNRNKMAKSSEANLKVKFEKINNNKLLDDEFLRAKELFSD